MKISKEKSIIKYLDKPLFHNKYLTHEIYVSVKKLVYKQAFEQVFKRVNPEIEKLLWLKMVKSSESMFEQGDWVIYILQPVAYF
jgi:hypothetical protein